MNIDLGVDFDVIASLGCISNEIDVSVVKKTFATKQTEQKQKCHQHCVNIYCSFDQSVMFTEARLLFLLFVFREYCVFIVCRQIESAVNKLNSGGLAD